MYENNKPFVTIKYKSVCVNCKTRFIKDKLLFNCCPVCRGTNIKTLMEG